MDLSKIKPSVEEIVQTALLFPQSDPRRRQILSLLAFDDEALSQLAGMHEDQD